MLVHSSFFETAILCFISLWHTLLKWWISLFCFRRVLRGLPSQVDPNAGLLDRVFQGHLGAGQRTDQWGGRPARGRRGNHKLARCLHLGFGGNTHSKVKKKSSFVQECNFKDVSVRKRINNFEIRKIVQSKWKKVHRWVVLLSDFKGRKHFLFNWFWLTFFILQVYITFRHIIIDSSYSRVTFPESLRNKLIASW